MTDHDGPTVFLTDSPAPEDVELISAGLDEFNLLKMGFNDRRPLAVLVRDPETRRVVGGLSGRTTLGLLFVDLFYLPPELRGSGLGSQILREAEDEGRRRGCTTAVLYTINFQAPEFYERNGWLRFGEVSSSPDISRVFLTKSLVDV